MLRLDLSLGDRASSRRVVGAGCCVDATGNSVRLGAEGVDVRAVVVKARCVTNARPRATYVVAIPACARSITRYVAKLAAGGLVMDRVCAVGLFLHPARAASTRGFVARYQDNPTIKLALGCNTLL
jgi:hypothetical protein